MNWGSSVVAHTHTHTLMTLHCLEYDVRRLHWTKQHLARLGRCVLFDGEYVLFHLKVISGRQWIMKIITFQRLIEECLKKNQDLPNTLNVFQPNYTKVCWYWFWFDVVISRQLLLMFEKILFLSLKKSVQKFYIVFCTFGIVFGCFVSASGCFFCPHFFF